MSSDGGYQAMLKVCSDPKSELRAYSGWRPCRKCAKCAQTEATAVACRMAIGFSSCDAGYMVTLTMQADLASTEYLHSEYSRWMHQVRRIGSRCKVKIVPQRATEPFSSGVGYHTHVLLGLKGSRAALEAFGLAVQEVAERWEKPWSFDHSRADYSARQRAKPRRTTVQLIFGRGLYLDDWIDLPKYQGKAVRPAYGQIKRLRKSRQPKLSEAAGDPVSKAIYLTKYIAKFDDNARDVSGLSGPSEHISPTAGGVAASRRFRRYAVAPGSGDLFSLLAKLGYSKPLRDAFAEAFRGQTKARKFARAIAYKGSQGHCLPRTVFVQPVLRKANGISSSTGGRDPVVDWYRRTDEVRSSEFIAMVNAAVLAVFSIRLPDGVDLRTLSPEGLWLIVQSRVDESGEAVAELVHYSIMRELQISTDRETWEPVRSLDPVSTSTNRDGVVRYHLARDMDYILSNEIHDFDVPMILLDPEVQAVLDKFICPRWYAEARPKTSWARSWGSLVTDAARGVYAPKVQEPSIDLSREAEPKPKPFGPTDPNWLAVSIARRRRCAAADCLDALEEAVDLLKRHCWQMRKAAADIPKPQTSSCRKVLAGVAPF